MLYNVVVNDWDETTYVPTALGNALLAAVIVVLLVAAVTFARLHIRIQKQAQKGDRKELTIRQLRRAVRSRCCPCWLPACPDISSGLAQG